MEDLDWSTVKAWELQPVTSTIKSLGIYVFRISLFTLLIQLLVVLFSGPMQR
jgi:hypothetical protein